MLPVMSALYVLELSQWQAYVVRGTFLMVQRADQNSPAENVLVSRWQVLDYGCSWQMALVNWMIVPMRNCHRFSMAGRES